MAGAGFIPAPAGEKLRPAEHSKNSQPPAGTFSTLVFAAPSAGDDDEPVTAAQPLPRQCGRTGSGWGGGADEWFGMDWQMIWLGRCKKMGQKRSEKGKYLLSFDIVGQQRSNEEYR